MIGMAKKPGKKKRAALTVIMCVVLIAAAVALGSLWALYRAYPYDWRPAIEQNAALYGQDPLFVAAIIKTESNWRHGALSGVGAMGLMQIMPATGEWIASTNGWDYSKDKLDDANYNVQLGCWYLNYLTKKFGGDDTLALAAYNAGDNTVQKWISEGRFKDGKADIPYAETRSFVKKVMNAYEKYKFLYKSR